MNFVDKKFEKKHMGLTVVIPYFNSYKTIVECVDSILGQDINIPYEIIIVDDGSTVKVPDAIANNHNIKIFTKNNGGVSSARNFGAQMANYNLIAFIDSDDIWLKNKISTQLMIMEIFKLECLGSSWSSKYLHSDKLFKLNKYLLPIKWWPHISTIVIGKELFHQINGFDENLRYAEDGDFLLKLAKLDKLYVLGKQYIENDIGKEFRHSEGLSSNLISMVLGEVRVTIRHFKYLSILYLPVIFGKFLIRYMRAKLNRVFKNG